MASIIYLAKDGSDLVCHCKCKEALITFPAQMDCPWCGCGWLFSCIECRKAFTFARGVKVETTWQTLARRDRTNFWGKTPKRTEVAQWVAIMKDLLADVEEGQRYVIFDGAVIPADVDAIEFDGWHSHHELDFVPQVAALKKKS